MTRNEKLSGGNVKGGLLKARVEWMRENRTPRDSVALDESLSEKLRSKLHAIDTDAWHPFAELIELDRAIVTVLAAGDTSVLRQIGRYSARKNRTAFRETLTRESIHEFFRTAARVHSNFQNFGTVRYKQEGEHKGRMIHSNYVSYSPLFCESAVGYYEESLALHRAVSPKVTETECQCAGATSCIFEMSWR